MNKKYFDFYNLILGGLIALSSEQAIGNVSMAFSSESIFLGKWLKKVKKQKRYPKSISIEIDTFLELYSQHGQNSALGKLFNEKHKEIQIRNNLSCVFTGNVKFHFDKVINILKNEGWFISLPLDHDHKLFGPYRPSQKKELFTTAWHWDGAFHESGCFIKPFSFFIFGCPQEVIDSFYLNGLILIEGVTTEDENGNKYHQLKVFPNNEGIGKVAIPTEFKLSTKLKKFSMFKVKNNNNRRMGFN